MSFVGVLLCITAALAWGGLDVCRKWLGERGDPKSIAAWLALFQVPGFALWWSVQGHVDLLPYAAVGLGLILINTLALVTFVWAVRISPLSLTIPYLSFTPVFVAWAAWFILGERLSLAQWAGSSLVVIGGLVLNAERGVGIMGLFTGLRRTPGAPLMLLTALLWSVGMPLDKLALRWAHVSSHGLIQNLGVGLLLLLFLGTRPAGRHVLMADARNLFKVLLGSALVGGVAMTVQLYGLLEAPAGPFEALKRTIGLVILPILGGHFFGERVNAKLLWGLGLIGSGSAAVILGGTL